MRGAIRPARDVRGHTIENRWKLRVDLPLGTDGKRRQRQVTYEGTKKEAQAELRKLCTTAEGGDWIDPNKLVLGDWLERWLEVAKASLRRRTAERYEGALRIHLKPSRLGQMLIQRVRATDIEAHFVARRGMKRTAASSLLVEQRILSGALRKATRDRLIGSNPMLNVEAKPRPNRRMTAKVRERVWTVDQAQTFLRTAKEAGPLPYALWSLALDTGMRRGELLGLRWANVDLQAGTVRIVEQLLDSALTDEGVLDLGPLKAGRTRTITIAPGTVTALRTWRQAQRERSMAHRDAWKDFGLCFTTDEGHPMAATHLGPRDLARLIRTAKVPHLTPHSLRHTAATLLLMAGVPVQIVSERLGHSKVSTTLDVYTHCLSGSQDVAASMMSRLLAHG